MAKDIMTPRTVVMALPESATVADALQIPMTVPFTRLPIYGKDLDEVTGFVLREDLYAARDRGQEHQPVVSLKREMLAMELRCSSSLCAQHASSITTTA